MLFERGRATPALPTVDAAGAAQSPSRPGRSDDPQRNFRFFDNRQKYLLFVNTCSEKWEVANRVSLELANIHPRPPAVRVFDAGVGDGTVLARVMRSMHDRFPTMPFYIVGKEISLEDVRLTLQKMADRFIEHPASVLVLTNLAYAEAPWLAVKSVSAATSMVWNEVALEGNTAHRFEQQITALEPFLGENWKARVSPKSGNPVYERPVVLVLYRDDHKFLLDQVIPKPGGTVADYDLVIASQPYRARASLEFKAKRVLAPLARALGPGGAHDRDPFLRPRSRHGDHPQGLAERQSVHAQPPRSAQGGEAGAGAGGARSQFQRLCGSALAVPLRHAHAAVGNLVLDRHLDAARRLERRRSMWRRSRTTGWPTSTATAAISRRRATCCRSTAGCGSTTNPS